MSQFNNAWAAALEDSAPVAEIDIDINEAPEIDTDEDGAPLEGVDAYGEPTYEVLETEMVEDEAEYEEADDVVENLDETVAQLESAAVAVENRIANNGGMTNGELEFMMIGLEGRVKNTKSLFPSTESFSRSKLTASQEAKKSLKEGIAWLWKTLCDAIDAVIRKLREWFGTTKRAAAKLKTRAEAIVKEGEKLKGKTAKEKKITLNAVHSFVTGGNKFASTGSEAENQMKVLTTAVNDVFNLRATKAWSEYINAYQLAVDDVIKNGASSSMSEEDMISKVTSVKGYAYAGYLYTQGMSDAGDRFPGTSSVKVQALPGNTTVFLQYVGTDATPKTAEAFESAKGKRGIVVAPTTTAKATEKKSPEFDVLAPGNIENIAGYVVETCDAISAYDAAWGNRDKAVSATQTKVTAAIKALNANKAEGEDEAKRSKVIGALLRGLTHDIKAAPARDAKLIQYALTTSKDYLQYCTRSISAYKEGKVPADKASKDEDAKAPPVA